MGVKDFQRKLKNVCRYLERIDRHLLEHNVHERTVTARLAHYLQIRIGKSYFVDCEYNKQHDGVGNPIPKSLIGLRSGRRRVMPDIIVHRRTAAKSWNFAVIEAKPSRYRSRFEGERHKVRAYLSEPSLKYKYGYLVKIAKRIVVERVSANKVWEI